MSSDPLYIGLLYGGIVAIFSFLLLFVKHSIRQRVEGELRESERLLRTILDNSLTVVYLKDLSGKYILINCRYEDLFHVSRKNVIGMSDHDLFPPAIADTLRSNDIKVFESRGPLEFEEVVAQDDGLHTYISIKFPILSPQGEPYAICGISTDITGRKEMEDDLRTAILKINNEKAKTDAIIAAIGDGISIQDTNYKILYQNRKHIELIGEQTGRYCYEAYERRDRVCDPCPVAMSFLDGKVHTVERNTITDRGTIYVEITASPLLDSSGNIIAGIEAVRDITTRRKAEEALRISEEKYRGVIDNIGIGVALISRDMEIISMNRQMKQWFPEVSDIDRPICYKAYNSPPVQDVCSYCPVVKTLRDGKVHEAISETPSGGEIRNYRIVASPLLDKDGEIEAAIEMVEDVTESKRIEDELKRSREQLRAFAAHLQTARENERTMIAREIHDELAQALTVLKIDVSEIAVDSDRLRPEDAQQLLAKTSAIAGFIDDTIEVVHRISMELRPSILDDIGLTAAIEWQAHEFQKRTRIQCDLKQDVTARIDRDLCTALFRVFQEALTNVLRHANATKVKIELFEEDGNVILVVEDNGIGIAEDRVFDARSLGLLGMRERIEMFGGKISFKGITNKGTIVTVSVPAG